MEKINANRIINQFINISCKLNELEKKPVDFGTGEVLYPSEIHTIDAVGANYETVTAISDKFGITKGAVSQVIVKLNKKGYIQKKRSEVYSKEIILTLTAKGKKAYYTHKKLHEIMDAGMVKLINSYSAEWLATFENMLIAFGEQIDQYHSLGDEVRDL